MGRGGRRVNLRANQTNISVDSANDPPPRILVVDDHDRARESMTEILRHAGHEAHPCSSAVEALAYLKGNPVDLVITDLQMPGIDGLDFIRRIAEQHTGLPVIMVTAYATVSSAVEAMRHGAFDYIEKPFRVEQLEGLVRRALEQGHTHDATCPLSTEPADRPTMIGASPQMRELRARIAQVAPTSETVLITGESGTGKELVARALHAASLRAAAPLVSLNCPVLSAQLMESELFGHERGAFTGADAPRTGRFELADGGTILLDEVTEIELPLQAKLLRVLQEKTFERVGSSRPIDVDVRVLATSNRDLADEVRDGNFREDLYFRLAVLPIHVPSLRQRREDIPELIDHFLAAAAARLQRDPATLESDALDRLLQYDWPGNVRELQNIITRASVLTASAVISDADLAPWLIAADSENPGGQEIQVGLSLHEMERKLIEATLDKFGGHRAKTAEALGIGVRTLSGKLKSYGYSPRAKAPAKAA